MRAVDRGALRMGSFCPPRHRAAKFGNHCDSYDDDNNYKSIIGSTYVNNKLYTHLADS